MLELGADRHVGALYGTDGLQPALRNIAAVALPVGVRGVLGANDKVSHWGEFVIALRPVEEVGGVASLAVGRLYSGDVQRVPGGIASFTLIAFLWPGWIALQIRGRLHDLILLRIGDLL